MKKRVNGLMLLFSLLGAGLGCAASEVISRFVSLNSIVMSGIYFTLPIILALTGAILAECISPFFSENISSVYVKCSVISILVAVVGGIVVSMGAQFLYETQWVKSNRNIVLTIDTSGSMDSKIENAFKAAEQIVDMTYPDDKVALIYFDTNAKRIMGLSKMDEARKKELEKYLKKGANARGKTYFDTALKAASDEVPVNGDTAVFMITDGESSFNNQTETAFLNKNAALYVIDVAANDNTALKSLAKKSGGKYSHSVNLEIGSEMNKMFDLYLGRDDGMLLKELRRKTLTNPQWYYIMINSLLYLLLGLITSLAYTILVNRKDILFLYNIVGGAAAALINELNNFIFRIDFIPAVLMFALICPAICIVSNSVEDKSSVMRISGPTSEKLIK